MDESIKQQFSIQVECARKAGIYDKFFLSFGTLLGYARHGGVIPGDDDMDVGILADNLSKDQIDTYVNEVNARGLFKYRERHEINPVNGKHFWISLRMFPEGRGLKCCTWFMWNFKGFTWHCKGIGALVKGCPDRYLQIGPEVEYYGTVVHIPKYSGAALDFWYPDWGTPRKGGNSHGRLMTVTDWGDQSKWVIQEEE